MSNPKVLTQQQVDLTAEQEELQQLEEQQLEPEEYEKRRVAIMTKMSQEED